MGNFNPRSHEGSDRGQDLVRVLSIIISIHAPTRGATTRSKYSRRRTRRFQSTLPRGERRWTWPQTQHRRHYFNPRSHEGSDAVC